jgi:23S rRNA (pseudouridine1915-N3)-methyltransferase
VKIRLIVVGRLRAGWAREACDDFLGRLRRSFPTELIEVRDARRGKAGTVRAWREEEAERIRAALPRGATWVALDERGRQWDSRGFARWLSARRDAGVGTLAFVIGGPDGLDPSLRAEASEQWSLGSLTMPHELARVVLTEQLFRAASILRGSPYHRD